MAYKLIFAAGVLCATYYGIGLAYNAYVTRAVYMMWVSNGRDVYLADTPAALWKRANRAAPVDSAIKLEPGTKVRLLDREFLTTTGIVKPYPMTGSDPHILEVEKVRLLSGVHVGMEGWLLTRDLEYRTPFL